MPLDNAFERSFVISSYPNENISQPEIGNSGETKSVTGIDVSNSRSIPSSVNAPEKCNV